MKGSRNRKVWVCSACKQKCYTWRTFAQHLWAKHRIALIRKLQRVSPKYPGADKEVRHSQCS